jgi:hypothetical protein
MKFNELTKYEQGDTFFFLLNPQKIPHISNVIFMSKKTMHEL